MKQAILSVSSLLLLGGFLLGPTGCEPEMGAPGAPGNPGDKGNMGDKGDKGDKGDPGTPTPSLGAALPATVFVGRSVLLQVSGSNTSFSDKTTVDLGDAGLKVTKVEVGGSGNLRVSVDVGADSRLGAHDVTVKTPGAGPMGTEQVLTLKGGLSLQASLIYGAQTTKTVPQGGFLSLEILNLDATTPLTGATISKGIIPFGALTVPAGGFGTTGFLDALQPAGAFAVTVNQKDVRGRSLSSITDPADTMAPQVTARAPTVLTAGAAKTGESIASNQATNLYKLTTVMGMDDQVALLRFANVGSALQTAAIISAVASTNGRFGEGYYVAPSFNGATATALLLLPKAGDAYLSVTSQRLLGGAANYGYDISYRLLQGAKLMSLKEPMGGDTAASPLLNILNLGDPLFGVDGAIDAVGDLDYITFKAGRTGRVYVQGTTTGLSNVVNVTLFAADCTTPIPGAITRIISQEAAVTAGTSYCARIGGSALPYQLVMTIE